MQHHAYLIEDSTSLDYTNWIRTRERIDSGDPDFTGQKYEKFGIEEARDLTMRASLKKMSARATFVLTISSITLEAQQALLKLFEEPQEGLTFYVVTPPGLFIPTLKSRFLSYEEKISEESDIAPSKEFLASAYAKRSAWITSFLKNDDEDMREQTRSFVNGLESILYAELQKTRPDGIEAPTKSSKELLEGLADISHFRQYLGDRAPSLKMILEHFAATLPQVK